MRVAVLCRKLDGKPTNGFERYSHNLVAGLADNGLVPLLPNQAAQVPIRPSGSVISPPFYDILFPAWQIISGRLKADVFHAVTDSQAIMFPWLRGRKVVTMHHVDKTPSDSISEAVFRTFYNLGTRIALRQADRIICISSQTRDEVMNEYGVGADRIEVISQAISSSFRPLPMARKEGTIGYIGALKKRKNVEFLVRAYSNYLRLDGVPPLRLVIYGEGSDRPFLVSLSEELGISDRVDFREPIDEDRLVDVYNSFSLFALPSHQEGFGFPIIEAQACAVPVLTVKNAMIPEEVTRCTVKCTDEGDMAGWMARLMMEADTRERIIAEGVDYAANFSIKEMGDRTRMVYQSVCAEGES